MAWGGSLTWHGVVHGTKGGGIRMSDCTHSRQRIENKIIKQEAEEEAEEEEAAEEEEEEEEEEQETNKKQKEEEEEEEQNAAVTDPACFHSLRK
jgi:hypothetical protein